MVESPSDDYQQSNLVINCPGNQHSTSSFDSTFSVPDQATSSLALNDDFVQYVSQSSLNDEKRLAAFENHFKPNKKYKFPSKDEYGKMRSFQHSWLEEHSWLVYSPHVDGAFCKVCVLFSIQSSDKNASKCDKLVKSPLTFWTTASNKFKDHESKSQLHKSALIRADNFIKVVRQEAVPIKQLISSQLSTQIAEIHSKNDIVLW